METNNNDKHPEGCRCMACQGGKCEMCGEKHCPYHGFGGCGYGYGLSCRRHVIFRIILAVVISFAIFWIGIRVGSFMGFGGYGDGYRMMRGGYYPMMGYWENGAVPAATSTAQ
jgi:hypothetical protein